MLTSMSWRWNPPLMTGELHTIGGRRLADIWPVFSAFGSRDFDVFAPRLAAWVGIASVGTKVSSPWCCFHFLAPPVSYTCIDGRLCLCGWFVVPLSSLSVGGSLPLVGVLWSGKLSICSWRAVMLRVLIVGPSETCPTDIVGPNEMDSPCSTGQLSGCPAWVAAVGGGPYPIIVRDDSHLWRQYRLVMVRRVSNLTFIKALRLLSSMDSCACV